MDLKTPLSKAKGLGSLKGGAHHWWMQRITAIALVPLVTWLVCSLVYAIDAPGSILHLLHSPFHATAMVLFIGISLYHGSLGMKVVYEDYISCICTRTFMIIATNLLALVLAVATILAVLQAHLGQSYTEKGVGVYKKTTHYQQDLSKKKDFLAHGIR